MNIFLRELKANRKALIIWSACMFLLILSGMSKYTAYSAGGTVNELFKKIPQSLKAILGIGPYDVTIMSGFFAFLFLYIEITVAIHAALLGAGIIAKEERDKTSEFLMTRPVSRAAVVLSKLAAAFVNILVLNIVTFVSSVISVGAYNKGASITGEIACFMASMFIVQLIFLSLGAASAAFMKNPRTSGSLSVGVMLASFVIAKVTDLDSKLDILNLLSPFKYFSYADIASGKGLAPGIALLAVLLAAVLFALTFIFYRRRDLKV